MSRMCEIPLKITINDKGESTNYFMKVTDSPASS
jgi:hypothetical protein